MIKVSELWRIGGIYNFCYFDSGDFNTSPTGFLVRRFPPASTLDLSSRFLPVCHQSSAHVVPDSVRDFAEEVCSETVFSTRNDGKM